MRSTAPEEVMQKRRLERLRSLTFFMTDERVPPNARRVMTLHGCHNLLTGFFHNSHWLTAWWVFKKAVENSWMETTLTARIFWHRRFMRRSDEEMDEIFSK